MNKDRNTLRQGVSSILGSAARRASALDQDGESTGGKTFFMEDVRR